MKWKEDVIQEDPVWMKERMRQMLPFPTSKKQDWSIPSVSLWEITISLFLELGRVTGCAYGLHSILRESKMVPSMGNLSWSPVGT